MRKIPIYICPAIGDQTCSNTTNCCPHRVPHQRVGSCLPKDCRFNPGGKPIECVLVPDPDAPVVPAAPKTPAVVESRTDTTIIKVATSPDQAENDGDEDAD